MKTIALFGAGQAGMAAARLMGSGLSVCCFADNAPEKQGTTLMGIPVVSLPDSLRFSPEAYCICVTDRLRAAEMENQLRSLGYAGEIYDTTLLRMLDTRAAVMRLLAEEINALEIRGDAAELGVYKGEFASMINSAFPGRKLHLFDTFCGFSGRDIEAERINGFENAKTGDFSGTSAKEVLAALPLPEQAIIHEGWFPESFETCMECEFAFVSLDADLYAPTAAALPLFWDRLSAGGALLVHDVNGAQFPGAGKAVREFCMERGVYAVPAGDLHGSVVIRKY